MFDISADWPKNTKFCTRKHSYMQFRTLSTLYHFHIQITKFDTHKMLPRPQAPPLLFSLFRACEFYMRKIEGEGEPGTELRPPVATWQRS